MKVILFIAALALFISPMSADAALVLNRNFETSTGYWTFSNIDLRGGYYQAKEGTYSVNLSRSSAGWIQQSFASERGLQYQATLWLAANPDGGSDVKTIWVSAGSVSNLQYTLDAAGNTRQSMGWTAATTTLLFASQIDTSYGPAIDPVQAERTPDPIPSSIIFFAPGLAAILVGRNWPQIASLRRAKRKIPALIHLVSGFPSHGNVLKRILLTNGFIAYFQFIHFKLRTIQLNQ